MLRFDLDRVGHRTGTHRREGLHPDGVDGVRRQLRDGRQLAVVHHLRVPGRFRLVRVRRVVHFVALFFCLFWEVEN